MIGKLFFSSVLATEYREKLESLLFFNPHQERVISSIVDSLEEFGTPEICVDGETLRVKVGECSGVQTLFAFDRNEDQEASLAGVMVYSCVEEGDLVLLHIAVREEYSAAGVYADEMLVVRFLAKLREIGRRIKNIYSITIFYDQQGTRIPV